MKTAPAVPRTAVGGGRRPSAGRPAAPRDVRVVLRTGKVAHGGSMVVRSLARGDQAPVRLAVVASRKLGGAVARNRARRRLREALRAVSLPAGHDLVAVAKPRALTATFEELVREAGTLVATACGEADQA